MKMEIWTPIVGYEGFYEVSDAGRVRSLDRSHATKNRHTGGPMFRARKGRQKAVTPDKDGYLQVRLCRDGNAVTHRLSRIVLLAFTGTAGEEACHINHDPKDNRLSNLTWGTRADNERQKDAAGRRPVNTRKPPTPEFVLWVRSERALGKSYRKIALSCGMSASMIWSTDTEKFWKGIA